MSHTSRGIIKTIAHKKYHTILVPRILLETLSELIVLEPSFESQ